jgi:hypothetical protein
VRGPLIPLVILVFIFIFGGSGVFTVDLGCMCIVIEYQISTWFVISNHASSGTAERKSCTTVSRRMCGRTQGILAGGVNERCTMPGFKLGEGDSEHKDGEKDEDTTGASIGASVSCGVLEGEWESARM